MSDISFLYRINLKTGNISPLISCSAADLRVKEKQIEKWITLNPSLLFTDAGSVMVIAQELSGELLADLLAVDSQGNLIIIEIKRHWSDRKTAGQILDYAARLSKWDYEAFNNRWKLHKGEQAGDLLKSFRNFVENPSFSEEDFLKTKRLFILASHADEGLKRIIIWLRDEYNVPIDFVPFTFFEDGDDVFLHMDKIDVQPIPKTIKFDGDWFFNTNETHSTGAWKNMIERGVIAAYGYGEATTKMKMDMPATGNRVFVYVNRKGIIAAGNITEEISEQGLGMFNKDTNGDEYHRAVDWITKVPVEKAISSAEVSKLGYNMPVRCTIGQWNDSKIAELVVSELKKREKK
ncbi:MAG: hypothetical protein IH984_04500 [Planctomycetes bacterium]|nr:hypothetical protein [Planctomycetota bacterium]